MRKIKVFISSVIGGYEDRRDAAEEAILELNRDDGFNFEPMRIDKKRYPSLNKSSQKACLDGVKECDIYLGIYPKDNYGWDESPVGISPTHEEFKQAVDADKCRLVFVENTKKIDLRQDAFLKEVKDYVDGRFLNDFETLNGLKHKVYRALLNLMNANFEDALPNYLNALLQRYERIVRPMTKDVGSLPVSDVVQLELRVEEQKDEKKSLTEYNDFERHSEKLSKSLMLSDALKEDPRLLVIGDPGAGKSTSLQWVTHSYAEQILNSSQKELPVPIYLELWCYDDSLLKLIETSFSDNGIACDEETITDWIKKGKFLFLLDGFDELDNPSKCLKEIKRLMAFSQENQFVVASRKTEPLKDLQNLGFKKVEVKHLSDSQIKLFIEKYLKEERGFRLLKELENYNLLKEARNPLILWFMILEFQREESQISMNKGVLFKNVIEHRFLKEWERKHGKDEKQKYTNLKINVLSKLAFSIIAEGDSVKIEEVKAEEIIYDFLKEGRKDYKEIGCTIKEQLLASHVLIKVGSQVSFWHKSFRDYFAALELLKLLSRDPGEFVKRYATKRWEESILFLVGIMDNPSGFVNRLIQPFGRYFLKSRSRVIFRLSLAAKCIGANGRVGTETQQKVIEQLTKIILIWESKGRLRELRLFFFPIFYNFKKAFQALGETKSEKASELLGEFLENHDHKEKSPLWSSCSFCQYAVEALRNMPLTEKVQNSLLFAALRHNDGVVRAYAQEILRENMSPEIASKLIEVMLNKNEKNVIHMKVVSELGLVIKDYPIRRRAIEIMCGYAGEELKYPDKVIDPLIQLALQEESDDLRSSAAWALCSYKGEDNEERIANSIIHALLKNPEPSIRVNAARSLIYHFSRNVRNALIQALSDENAKVRIRAAYTLSYVGIKTPEEENEASRKLSRLFSDEDPTVRQNAVYTYGIIGQSPTDEELSLLINLLRDNNISVRYRAAEALGRLKARAALDALKQMVYEEKYADPWASAIRAILQIEPSFSEVVKENNWEYPYIIQLSDDDIDNRRVAVDVLGRIGTEKSLPVLKEMYIDYDESSDIRAKLYYAIQDIEARIGIKSYS